MRGCVCSCGVGWCVAKTNPRTQVKKKNRGSGWSLLKTDDDTDPPQPLSTSAPAATLQTAGCTDSAPPLLPQQRPLPARDITTIRVETGVVCEGFEVGESVGGIIVVLALELIGFAQPVLIGAWRSHPLINLPTAPNIEYSVHSLAVHSHMVGNLTV